MNESTALKIACKLLKDTAQLHVDESLHYHAYIEAYNTLTAMQMGLDGECDGLVSIASENIDSDVFSDDEKAEGWRESELT